VNGGSPVDASWFSAEVPLFDPENAFEKLVLLSVLSDF
jgi:hypothetical protein